jgi:hypothetical protein
MNRRGFDDQEIIILENIGFLLCFLNFQIHYIIGYLFQIRYSGATLRQVTIIVQ